MAEPISIQQLKDASLDVKSLEEVVNGDENVVVTTRLGETYPSVKGSIKKLFENGGLPATPFATKALMTASALVDGDYAMVTDDTNNDNGLYIKDAGVWRRTSYTTKTNYKAIAENQDILALSAGDYYIPSFVIGDTLINMADVSQKLGIIKVENLAGNDVFKKITLSAFNSGTYTNNWNTVAWSGWRKAASLDEVLAVTDNKYLSSDIKNVVENQDILQLDFGDYFVDVFSLTNLINFPPVESYKYGRIEVKQNGINPAYKIITVSTYRDPAIYINKNNETGWMGWQKIGGSSEGASVFTPSLVMPPKIYIMSGLQSHIYPEHLLPEPSDLYLHDVDCALGKQMERGWVYDAPSGLGASTTALTWTLRDKQTASLLTSASTSIVTADSAKSGNKNVLVIGDSYVNGGIITQRLLDISATDALKTTLIGTRGTAPNKHEGRGGWTVNDYATNGRLFLTFTVSGVTTPPAINAASYDYTGGSFYVQEVNISGGSGTIIGEAVGAAPPTSGTLTKTNSSVGDASIAYSSVTTVSGNPFWFSGALNFGQYITSNSLATPDIVLINLGVNDSFGATSDDDAVSRATTAFAKLDNLIASIKAQNAAVKIGLIASPSYANQDAFGLDYGNSYTSWRCSRNIVIWNSELYKRYKDSEPQNIYTVAAGLNVDTKANFPTTTQATNSHNSTVITVQSNSVHPDVSGYRQMGDSIFSLIKAVL